MPVGDAYKLDLFQVLEGQRIMNSLAFDRKAEGSVSQAECQALADDWKNFLRLMQSNLVAYVSWKVTQLSGAGVSYTTEPCKRVGGQAFEGLFTGTLVGGEAGDSLPPQCARVTTLLTGFVGRSKRGRVYLAGVPEANTTNGWFLGPDQTGQVTAWNAQLAKFSGAGTDLVWRAGIWSQTIATGCKPAAAHPHSPEQVGTPAPQLAFTAVTAYKPRNIVYTQRRRTIGVGA